MRVVGRGLHAFVEIISDHVIRQDVLGLMTFRVQISDSHLRRCALPECWISSRFPPMTNLVLVYLYKHVPLWPSLCKICDRLSLSWNRLRHETVVFNSGTPLLINEALLFFVIQIQNNEFMQTSIATDQRIALVCLGELAIAATSKALLMISLIEHENKAENLLQGTHVFDIKGRYGLLASK